MSNDQWYKNWSDSVVGKTHNSYICECGLLKVFGKDTNLPHSDYCPMYVPIKPYDCECGMGGWHSPNCTKRDEDKDPIDR